VKGRGKGKKNTTWRQVKATLALVIVIVVLVRVLVLLVDGPAGSTMCAKISIPRLRAVCTGTHTHQLLMSH
jgi:hypothetical protein